MPHPPQDEDALTRLNEAVAAWVSHVVGDEYSVSASVVVYEVATVRDGELRYRTGYAAPNPGGTPSQLLGLASQLPELIDENLSWTGEDE